MLSPFKDIYIRSLLVFSTMVILLITPCYAVFDFEKDHSTSAKSEKNKDVVCLGHNQRPDALKEEIQASFEYIRRPNRRNDKWAFNGEGKTYYDYLNEYKLLKNLIQKEQMSDDSIFLLDIGAGEFQWGYSMSRLIEADPDIAPIHKINILSIRGEISNYPETEEFSKTILHNLGDFPIENLHDALISRGFPSDIQFQLIISRWCLTHLVDPLGTFLQAYRLLNQDSGLMLMDGFNFATSNTKDAMHAEKYTTNRLSALLSIFRDMDMPFVSHLGQYGDECLIPFVLGPGGKLPLLENISYSDEGVTEHKGVFNGISLSAAYNYVVNLPKDFRTVRRIIYNYEHMQFSDRLAHVLTSDQEFLSSLEDMDIFTSECREPYPLFQDMELSGQIQDTFDSSLSTNVAEDVGKLVLLAAENARFLSVTDIIRALSLSSVEPSLAQHLLTSCLKGKDRSIGALFVLALMKSLEAENLETAQVITHVLCERFGMLPPLQAIDELEHDGFLQFMRDAYGYQYCDAFGTCQLDFREVLYARRRALREKEALMEKVNDAFVSTLSTPLDESAFNEFITTAQGLDGFLDLKEVMTILALYPCTPEIENSLLESSKGGSPVPHGCRVSLVLSKNLEFERLDTAKVIVNFMVERTQTLPSLQAIDDLAHDGFLQFMRDAYGDQYCDAFGTCQLDFREYLYARKRNQRAEGEGSF